MLSVICSILYVINYIFYFCDCIFYITVFNYFPNSNKDNIIFKLHYKILKSTCA